MPLLEASGQSLFFSIFLIPILFSPVASRFKFVLPSSGLPLSHYLPVAAPPCWSLLSRHLFLRFWGGSWALWAMDVEPR